MPGAQIFVEPFPAQGGQRFVATSTGAGYPMWRGDGRELFFTQDNTLMAMSVATEPRVSFGTPAMVFDLPGGATYTAEPSGATYPFAAMKSGNTFAITAPRPEVQDATLTVFTDWKRAAGITK